MREKRVLGEPAARRAPERVDLVRPFAGEAPLAEEVLIDVRYGSRVWIDAGMPRVDGGEARAERARQRDSDARLDDAVSTHDAAMFCIVHGAVERMRDRADEERGRVGWEHGIGIDGDDVADAANRL